MSAAYEKQPDCSILNSGSIRIDDQISGEITQFDIIRAMPFGGGIVKVTMKGDLLRQVLDAGVNSKGKGAYLQWNKIQQVDGKGWKINGKNIADGQNYSVALNDFLLLGLDIEILKEDSPGIVQIEKPAEGDIKNDIRLLVIDYLKKQK